MTEKRRCVFKPALSFLYGTMPGKWPNLGRETKKTNFISRAGKHKNRAGKNRGKYPSLGKKLFLMEEVQFQLIT